MGKKREVMRVLVVDSVGNVLAPMFAACFNGDFDPSEDPAVCWANFARAFEHDGDSPRVIDREVWNFMTAHRCRAGGMRNRVECIGDLDLCKYDLIYCIGTEAFAEVRGMTDRMEKRGRPDVGIIDEDIENPLEDTGEDNDLCIDAESESELDAAANQRLTMLELLAAQIKRITSGLMPRTPDVEPARR